MTQGGEVRRIQEMAARLRANVQRVVVGKDEAIDQALVALLCGGHALIQDVPGIGKTTLAKALAQSLGCTFKRIQFTPDLMPSDVVGVSVYNQQTGHFQFRPGPIFAQVLLADEINRATPRTQAALLESMQERQVTVDGETMPLPAPFLVMATQNPVEMEGTFPLPEAQLDRFMLCIRLGYPSEDEESQILRRFSPDGAVAALEPVVSAAELAEVGGLLAHVQVEESVADYAVQVARATRSHSSLYLGASPRATLALYWASRAWAAIQGRDFVLPDDVKAMAPVSLPHRLLLSSQARLRGQSTDDVVREVLESVPVPLEQPG